MGSGDNILEVKGNENQPRPKFQILGMFDSGTNLLGKLLAQNIGFQNLRQMCPGAQAEGFHCHFWKHTPPTGSLPIGPQMKVVGIVRAPLAQISSWVKAPYDLESCLYRTNWHQDQKTPCQLRGKVFPGLSGVWNQYTRSYDAHAAANSNFKVVTYESLVLNTEAVVRDIGRFVGVEFKQFKQLEFPAKRHGNAVGRSTALAKIRNSGYMSLRPWTSPGAAAAVCRNLDHGLMRAHSITADKTYEADCLRVAPTSPGPNQPANHHIMEANTDPKVSASNATL